MECYALLFVRFSVLLVLLGVGTVNGDLLAHFKFDKGGDHSLIAEKTIDLSMGGHTDKQIDIGVGYCARHDTVCTAYGQACSSWRPTCVQSEQYVCGTQQCGTQQCGTQQCGQHNCGTQQCGTQQCGTTPCGSYACGTYICGYNPDITVPNCHTATTPAVTVCGKATTHCAPPTTVCARRLSATEDLEADLSEAAPSDEAMAGRRLLTDDEGPDRPGDIAEDSNSEIADFLQMMEHSEEELPATEKLTEEELQAEDRRLTESWGRRRRRRRAPPPPPPPCRRRLEQQQDQPKMEWNCAEVRALQKCCNANTLKVYKRYDANVKSCEQVRNYNCKEGEAQLDFTKLHPAEVIDFLANTCSSARRLEEKSQVNANQKQKDSFADMLMRSSASGVSETDLSEALAAKGGGGSPGGCAPAPPAPTPPPVVCKTYPGQCYTSPGECHTVPAISRTVCHPYTIKGSPKYCTKQCTRYCPKYCPKYPPHS